MKLRVPINERDHSLGPANASVTVVNYGAIGVRTRSREI